MNTLSLSFEGHQVRFVGTADNPAWVAQDVCEILEIKNHRDALASLDEDEKDAVGIPDSIGRVQETLVVNQSGLYALCFKSRKPAAKRFRKWVTSEVLPSILKHGCYPPPATPFVDEAFAFTLEMLKLVGKAISSKLNLSYTPSAQKINELLEKEGLQWFQMHTDKKGKKHKEWHPTEQGQNYSQVLIDTAPGHGKTISKLCWFNSVLPLIQRHFEVLN